MLKHCDLWDQQNAKGTVQNLASAHRWTVLGETFCWTTQTVLAKAQEALRMSFLCAEMRQSNGEKLQDSNRSFRGLRELKPFLWRTPFLIRCGSCWPFWHRSFNSSIYALLTTLTRQPQFQQSKEKQFCADKNFMLVKWNQRKLWSQFKKKKIRKLCWHFYSSFLQWLFSELHLTSNYLFTDELQWGSWGNFSDVYKIRTKVFNLSFNEFRILNLVFGKGFCVCSTCLYLYKYKTWVFSSIVSFCMIHRSSNKCPFSPCGSFTGRCEHV